MEAIRVERRDGLVTITIDRPEKKNALNARAWVELDRAFADVAANPDDRALVLTGAGGNSWLLPRRIGLHKAKELTFFADVIDAKEAESIGLVNKVVPAAELDAVAEQWGNRLAASPTLALGLSKRLLDASSCVSFEQALEDEARCQHIAYTGADMREGIAAFVERRDARFRGC